MKKPSIILAIVLIAASLLTTCGRQGPVPPPDKTPPSIMSTFPADGSLNVPVNLSGGIAITFSKLMDASTINNQTVALSNGQNNVPGLVTYTEIYNVPIAVFTPSSSLNPATRYTVTVDRNVKDAYGIPMNNTYTCFFDTETAPDTTPPSVTATNPAEGTTGVVVNIDPSVTFSEPVSLATITFTLSAEGGAVPGTLSYSGTTAIFTPSNLLLNNTQYTVSVSAGLQDLVGNAMPNSYSWSFMTGSALDTTPPSVTATNPGAGTTGVVVNIAPSVTFSEPVSSATITFTLSAGGVAVPGTISYSGTTAIFTPSTPLAYTTQYTATVSAGVQDLAGNAMPNDYIWNFATGAMSDMTPPSVTATNPGAGTTGVVVNITPSVTFSEPVSSATITFTLSAGGAAVPGTISYSGTTAIFTPSTPLAYTTQYTATVSAGVQDLAGNAMLNDYSWSFTTSPPPDTTAPSVTANTPAAGATGVSVNIAPSVTFSELVSSATITFTLSAGGVPVDGYMAYSGMTSIFIPSTPLAYTAQYTAKVSAGVQDLAGNAMLNDYSWSFTTSPPPDTTAPSVRANTPAAGATGVSVNIAPSVTFSELVSSATITFTLSAGGAPVDGYMAYSGMTAIFIPSTPLAYTTQYTAKVSAGVQDLAGNAMLNDYSWSFTTSTPPDTTAPSVTANTPATGTTNVALNIAPSVTFSEPVNPATITFTLSAGGVSVAGNTTYSGTTAIFTPSIWLAYNTQYTASVSAGVQDLAGNPMPTGYFWSFTTGTAADMTAPYVTATTPGDQATGVAVNTAPSVTFSEPVDQATITFTLSAEGVTVPGTMSYSGTTAIFTPASKLRKNTTQYTARVSAGVRDLAGNSMQNDCVWTFWTGK